MKKIIGVALFFLIAAAPALAGGNSGGGSSNAGGGGSSRGSSGGFGMTGAMPHGSSGFGLGGFGSSPIRTFAPPAHEAPIRFAAEPNRKRMPLHWTQSEYIPTQSQCAKMPYLQGRGAGQGCDVNPWVLYAFPSSDF